MPRGRCTFRQRDVTAAIKAATAAGATVQRVEVSEGKITVVLEGAAVESPNEWDTLRGEDQTQIRERLR